MEKATTALLGESAKYGLLVMILVILIIALGAFVYLMWKQGLKEKKEDKQELMQVIKENSAAITQHSVVLTQLQQTINTLIQKL